MAIPTGFEDANVDLGVVIATRELEFERDGIRLPISVKIGRPQRVEDGETFLCPYRIDGFPPQPVKYAVGSDAIQALQLTLSVLDAELYAISRRYGGKLTWFGSEDLGFSPTNDATGTD